MLTLIVTCTCQVMPRDFLFANRLVRVGTLIGYDDWWTISCFRFYRHAKQKRRKGFSSTTSPPAHTRHISPLSVGEGLAHQDITYKYRVLFQCVAGPCKPVKNFSRCHLNNNWAPVFVVLAIGSHGDCGHGFEFSRSDELYWMENMKICPHVG